MADDFDIEALLEAPYNKKEPEAQPKESNGTEEKSRKDKSRKSRHRTRSRSRDKARKHSRSKDDRKHRRKSRSKDRHRSRSRDRHSRRRSSKDKRSRTRSPVKLPKYGPPLPPPRYSRKPSPLASKVPPASMLTPEERDARTVFCMQLSKTIRARDLEEFFSSVGKVRDVRMITCNKTRRFKGIAYIEFKDPESVPLAMGLNGQKLLGVPIVVQPTQAEKNRMANSMPNMVQRTHYGPMKLYVGSLHYNITEEMLRGIFEPFGHVDNIQLMMDTETGRSKGYGFLTYRNAEDAKKALEHLNGFEIAGRPMKVGHVTENHSMYDKTAFEVDELDRAGYDLGATGRLQLMYKLAEGTGFPIPQAAANALQVASGVQAAPTTPTVQVTPPIATQCFLLANMFDPNKEDVDSNTTWETEIRDDVIEECNKHGGVLHVYVDKASPQGNVYVKCTTIETALASVAALHGRWFGGRVITAAYVPVTNYHNLFPEASSLTKLLVSSRSKN